MGGLEVDMATILRDEVMNKVEGWRGKTSIRLMWRGAFNHNTNQFALLKAPFFQIDSIGKSIGGEDDNGNGVENEDGCWKKNGVEEEDGVEDENGVENEDGVENGYRDQMKVSMLWWSEIYKRKEDIFCYWIAQ